MQTIAFFGMGNMGLPMSIRLMQAGYIIKTVNFGNPAPLETAKEHGAVICENHTDCVSDADIIISIVTDDKAVRAIFFTPEMHDSVKDGVTIMEMTSCSSSVVRELADFYADRGVKVLDAPVTGGVVGAQTGKLSILGSGSAEDFTIVKPITDIMAQKLFIVGPNLGDGKLVKALTNMLAMVNATAIKEFWEIAQLQGLSAEMLATVVPASAGASVQFDRRWQDISVDLFASLPPFKLMFKDMGIALDECGKRHPLQMANLAYQLIKAMEK